MQNLKVSIDKSVVGSISFVFENKTLEHSLTTIAKSEKLKFRIDKGTLFVWSTKKSKSEQRTPSSINTDNNHIHLKFLSAGELHSKLKTLLDKGRKYYC